MSRFPSVVPQEPIPFHADAIRPQRLFRVTVDWETAGIAQTLPFPSATAAREWGLAKAAGRPGAVVTAEPRGFAPAEGDCATQCICAAGEQDVEAMRAGGAL